MATRTMRTIGRAAVVAILLGLCPRGALAQSTAAAEALFNEGRRAMDAKDYDTACQRPLGEARSRRPAPRVRDVAARSNRAAPSPADDEARARSPSGHESEGGKHRALRCRLRRRASDGSGQARLRHRSSRLRAAT